MDGEKGRWGLGKGVWRWGKMEEYIPIATVITRMTPELRWAAMRASLMFH